nr:hypothetical protein Q903MT_gene3700 [Picea sitchensis]
MVKWILDAMARMVYFTFHTFLFSSKAFHHLVFLFLLLIRSKRLASLLGQWPRAKRYSFFDPKAACAHQ